MLTRSVIPALAFLPGLVFALPAIASPELDRVREWRRANEAAIVTEFEALLAMPNVATNLGDVRRNADAIVAMLQRRGIEAQLLTDGGSATPPAVYAERRVAGATRTLLFYAHYDGQPVDATGWQSDPWTPTWRDARHDRGGRVLDAPDRAKLDPDWRLYARGAADDKAGVVAIVNALGALDALALEPSVNVRILFEGEEEAGSPHLPGLLRRHRALLGADAWIVCDGPVHSSGRKQVVYGVRGDMNVHLTVHGPKRPLHSGHYGNWAPNPAMHLAALLASMKDEDGRVAIEGWYEGAVPLGARERAALDAVPSLDESIKRELGLAATELGGGVPLVEAIQLPSLNVNGFRAGNVGAEASNAIMTEARATLDLRLVAGITPAMQLRRLVAHAEREGWHVIGGEPTDAERLAYPKLVTIVPEAGGYAASRTPMDLPIAQAVSRAIAAASEGPIVEMPTLGGSLPLVHVNEILEAPTIVVPIANADNNQHAEDENLRLGNLWDGIEAMAALMRLGE